MVLDPAANFVRGEVNASIASGDTTFSVTDASIFPDPSTEGDYNAVIWDAASHPDPYQDPDVEIVRVTAVDSTNDDLTVTRGQESTSDVSHPSESAIQMSPTAKMFSDIDSDKLDSASYTPEQDTHDRYTDGEARSALEAGDVTRIDFNNFDLVDANAEDGKGYLELRPAGGSNGNREDLVTKDVHISETGTWVAGHMGNSSAHHSRYTDSETRSAVEAGDVGGVQFSNEEQGDYDRDGLLYYDLSEGLYIKSSNAPNTRTGGALLWSGANVSPGNAISLSYDSSDKPTIAVDESQLDSGGVDVQTFSSSGTWNKPSGVSVVAVDVISGGGGGCAYDYGNSDNGAGGGGGGRALRFYQASNVPDSVSVTVGAGGSGGSSDGESGADGGSSSFGDLITVIGGRGGNNNDYGGAGGHIEGGSTSSGAVGSAGAEQSSSNGGSADWGGGGGGGGGLTNGEPGGSSLYGPGGGGGGEGGDGGSTGTRVVGAGPSPGTSAGHMEGGAGGDGTSGDDGGFPGGGGGGGDYDGSWTPGGDGGSGFVIIRSW